MVFNIVCDNRQMGQFFGPMHIVDSFSGDGREATEFARMYAIEHAQRIAVKVTMADYGALFTTNNGTLVRYYTVERN